MQRARWVTILIIISVLSLAGCRSEPSVAAYVGDRTYLVRQVDALADEATVAQSKGVARQAVLGWLVVRDIGRQMAARDGFTIPPGDVARTAAALGLPASSELARLWAETNALREVLADRAEPVEPTEAQQRELYRSMIYLGEPLSTRASFERIQPSLTKEQVGRALAVREILIEEVAKARVTINPRYAGLRFVLPLPVAVAGGTAVVAAAAYVPLAGPSVVQSRA